MSGEWPSRPKRRGEEEEREGVVIKTPICSPYAAAMLFQARELLSRRPAGEEGAAAVLLFFCTAVQTCCRDPRQIQPPSCAPASVAKVPCCCSAAGRPLRPKEALCRSPQPPRLFVCPTFPPTLFSDDAGFPKQHGSIFPQVSPGSLLCPWGPGGGERPSRNEPSRVPFACAEDRPSPLAFLALQMRLSLSKPTHSPGRRVAFTRHL